MVSYSRDSSNKYTTCDALADHHYCTSEEVEETRRRGNVDSLKGENASECASDLAKLLIVCGTTGCKKRRLISRLLNEFPQYFESVPLHTTKSSNETCTRLDAWLFQDEDTMRNDVEAGKYLFHDEIYDWLYGYKLEDIEARKLSGKVPTVILDNVRLLPQLVQQEIDCFLLFLQPTLSGDMLSKKSETSKGNGGSADAEAQMNCLKSSEVPFTVVKLAEEMEVSYHRLLQELHVLYPQILPSHAIWGYGRQLWNASYRVEGRRPLHVIVLGSSKKHTTILSKELSQVFQVPMFIFPELMEENLSGSLSDDYIVDILTQKLECEECMVKGWILVGFPFTNTQQTAMEAKGLIPDKVILLETNLLQLNKEDSSNKGEVQVEEERETFDCVGQVCKANTEELRRAFFPVSYDVPKDSTLEDALEQASSFIRVESSLGCNLLSQEPTTPQGYISSVIKYQRKLLVAVSEHKGKEKWLEASNLFDKAQHLILLHNPKMYSYVKSYTRRDIQTMEEDIVLKVIADAPGQLLMCLDVGLEEESEAFQHSKSHPFVLCMKKFDINSTTKLSHIDHDIEIRTQTVSCQSIRFLAGDSLYSIKADRCRPYTLNVYSNAEIELQSLDKTLEDFEYFVTCYTGEIQAPNTDNVIAILFRIEISVQMETVIEAKVTLNDETLERNLYFSLDNDIKVLNRCPYVKCKPEEGIHTLIAAFQQPSERKLFPKSMNWKLQLIADQKSVQFQQLPIQEVQKMTGVYEQNLNRRFCRHVITAKTKTEMSVVLALSNANLEFVFRVVSMPKSGVQWNGKIEETDVVYSNKFVGLGLILSIRLLPGKYLIEAVFQNSGSIQDETSWTLLISPSCSPGSLSIQPDQSRNELIKDSVKKWMEEKGGVKTRSIRATEALQNYENSKTL
eukprot:g7543.t1